METTKRLQILNMDWPYFILAFVILNLALFFKFLPGSLAGVLPLLSYTVKHSGSLATAFLSSKIIWAADPSLYYLVHQLW